MRDVDPRAHVRTCPPPRPSLRHTARCQLLTDPPRRDAFQKDPRISNVTCCGDFLKKRAKAPHPPTNWQLAQMWAVAPQGGGGSGCRGPLEMPAAEPCPLLGQVLISGR